MEEEEDVTTNPFFIALKQRFGALYQQVQAKCHVVCVPQAASLSGTPLTEEFMKLHILATSPYFQGSFTSLCDKTLEIEGNHITTGEGFPEQRKIKVLSEELFYNAQSQGFRVLLIERPFIGGAEVRDVHSILPKERTAAAVKYFLDSFPENELVLRKIDEMTGEFNQSYVIVKGFEGHVSKKVQDLCNYSVEALLCANHVFREFHYRNKHLAEFKEVVEVYVLNRLYVKLWDGFTTIFAKEDNDLFALASSLKNLRQSDVGIRQALQCSMVAPSRHFKYIDACTSPLEKLYCLKETCDLIMKTVAANQPPDSDESITTDDLIPFLVYIIVLSKPKYLRTNIFLMENLTFISLSTNEMGFNLVSLQAAVQYLKSKELAKFADSDGETGLSSAFKDNSPLKTIGSALFPSSFFSSSSLTSSSTPAPASDLTATDASASAIGPGDTPPTEKKSTYRISELTNDSSFPDLSSSYSRSTSSYNITSAYGRADSESGSSTPKSHYRSLSSLFPSFRKRQPEKSESLPAIASLYAPSSSSTTSAPSDQRAAYAALTSSSSAAPPRTESPLERSSSSSSLLSSSASYTAPSSGRRPTSISPRGASSSTYAKWSTQKPPEVITLGEGLGTSGSSAGRPQQNDLGDFLTRLQNVKDDALSSQG